MDGKRFEKMQIPICLRQHGWSYWEGCNVIYLMVDICLWDGWGISQMQGFMDPEVDI